MRYMTFWYVKVKTPMMEIFSTTALKYITPYESAWVIKFLHVLHWIKGKYREGFIFYNRLARNLYQPSLLKWWSTNSYRVPCTKNQCIFECMKWEGMRWNIESEWLRKQKCKYIQSCLWIQISNKKLHQNKQPI